MSYSQLLNLLWCTGHFNGRDFIAAAGEFVSVVLQGKFGEESGVWHGAEVIVDGERRRGSVVVGGLGIPDFAILRIVGESAVPVLDVNDRLVTQIEYAIEPPVEACFDGLCSGSAGYGCAGRIAGMDSLRRTDLYTKLLVDRLKRKTDDISRIFTQSDKDWNQTFHVMLLRVMGGDRNRDAFTELASKVTAAMVSREKSSHEKVEALLLGAAGFLHSAAEKDAYTLRLEEEFLHFTNKYSLIPLRPAEWNLRKIYPANHPALRLAETAALLHKKDFMLGNMLNCRTSRDVEALFAAEASEYWKTHYTPGAESAPSAKRIGKTKARLIGINLVAPLMFAYGKETGNDALYENAIDLLSTIPPENNKKLDGWRQRGCVPENGFESQALIQLGDCFCAEKACARCHIGRNEIKKALHGLTYAVND